MNVAAATVIVIQSAYMVFEIETADDSQRNGNFTDLP